MAKDGVVVGTSSPLFLTAAVVPDGSWAKVKIFGVGEKGTIVLNTNAVEDVVVAPTRLKGLRAVSLKGETLVALGINDEIVLLHVVPGGVEVFSRFAPPEGGLTSLDLGVDENGDLLVAFASAVNEKHSLNLLTGSSIPVVPSGP